MIVIVIDVVFALLVMAMRRWYEKLPVVKLFVAGRVVALRLAYGSAPTKFACCCIAKPRLARKSLAWLNWVTANDNRPARAMTMPRRAIATMISTRDMPRRVRQAVVAVRADQDGRVMAAPPSLGPSQRATL